MSNQELLFYDEYERFCEMAEDSNAFRNFCKAAFGEDFSQDGFSDIKQIDRILDYIPTESDIHILDIGCGNGKMDYSAKAIACAKKVFPQKAEFRQGNIGEIDYPEGQFDVITSMDTMYFATDMKMFLLQIMRWLKKKREMALLYEKNSKRKGIKKGLIC